MLQDDPTVLGHVGGDQAQHLGPVGVARAQRRQSGVDVKALAQGDLFDVPQPIVPGQRDAKVVSFESHRSQ